MQTPLLWILLALLFLENPLAQVSKRKKHPAPEPAAVAELRKELESVRQQLTTCQSEVDHLKGDLQIQSQAYQRAAKGETDWISFRKQFGWEQAGEPLHIRFLAEPITTVELYKDAAADLIASRFSKEFVLDPRASWTLTLGGTNLNSSTQAQYVEVELYYPLQLPLTQGELKGRWRVSSDAAMFTRFSEQARVQAVIEMIIRVLSQTIEQRRAKPTSK